MCRASCPDFFQEEKFRSFLMSGLNLKIGWILEMAGKYTSKMSGSKMSHCLLLSETAFFHFFFFVWFIFVWFGVSLVFALFETGCIYFTYTSKSGLLKLLPRSGWNQWFCLQENSKTTLLVVAWWRIFVICCWQKLLPLLQKAQFKSAQFMRNHNSDLVSYWV